MYILNKLEHNLVYYSSGVSLDLNYQGVTCITGRNKVAKLKGRNNGSGKSLLLSSISNIIYGTSPQQTSKHKDSAFDSGTYSKLLVNDQEFIKEQKGKSIKWTILSKGEDLEEMTRTKAESYVKDYFDITESQFYSTVFIDSRRPFDIHMGTVTDRFNYLIDMFELYEYDQIRENIGEKLKDIKHNEVILQEYTEQLEELGSVSKPDPKQIKELKVKIRKLRKQLESLLHIEECIDIYASQKDNLKYLSVDTTGLKALEKKQKNYIAWCLYQKHQKQWDKKCASITKPHSKLTKQWKSIEKLKDYITKETQKWSKAKANHSKILENNEECNELLEEIENDIKRVKILLRKSKKIKGNPDVIQSKLDHVLEHIELLENFLDGSSTSSCTMCGGNFNKKTAKSTLKKQQKLAETLEEQLSQASALIDINKELQEYSSLSSLKSHLNKTKKKIKKVPELPSRSHLSNAEKDLDLWHNINKILDSKPKAVIHEKDWSKEISELQKAQKAQQVIKTLTKKLKVGAQNKKRNIQGEIKSVRKDLKKLEETFQVSQQEYNKNQHNWDLKINLNKKIRELVRKNKDSELLYALHEAYGKNGLRLDAMRNICNYLQQKLNELAPLVFPEHFQFEITIDVNKFDIIVQRDKPHDVRYLSGSEGRSFCLLWLACLLPLIPSRKRFNILILDEVESCLDNVSRQLIYDKLLPYLSTIVPHIVMISPYGDMFPDCKYRWLEVVRNNSGSKLVEM